MLGALNVVLIVPRDLNLPRNPKLLENPNQVPNSLDLPGTVRIAVFHILLFNMLDALNVVGLLLNLPRNPDLPETVRIAVLHILLLNMLDALPVVVLLLNLPRNPDLPGTVGIAVFHILLLNMLGALHAVVLLLNLRHNVILAVSRYRLTTISPAVWNADLHKGRYRKGLHSQLLGGVLPNGVPTNLVAWMWSVPTAVLFIGRPR
jgi:hypothetical protein